MSTGKECLKVGTTMTWRDVLDHAVCVGILSEDEADGKTQEATERWLESQSDSIVLAMVGAAYDAIEVLLKPDSI